jgi:sigma-E factor negative regulatory protein RseC
MIEQQGRIVRIEGHRAWVEVGPGSGCSACDAGQGCGAGLFARLLRRRPMTIELENAPDFDLGRAVILGIPELFFLRLVLRLYALPLFAGLVGAWACHQISEAYGWSKGVTDLLTLAGLAGAAWATMARQRGALEARLVERQIEMNAAPESSACSSAGPIAGQ